MLPDAEPQPLERSFLELESRVRALEGTVAALGDTRQVEERVAERLSAQAPRVPVAAVIEAISAKPMPPAVKTMVGMATQPSTLRQVAQSSWLAFDMVTELTAVGRMLLDPHYHMAWMTRIVFVLFAIAIVSSGWWFPMASWLGGVPDKLIDLVLAGVLFLALFCETRRYKEWRSKPPLAG
jgi:hypothetical protein